MAASSLARMVFGFLSVTVAARIIPEEDFGVYFLLLAMVYLLEVIGNLGLGLSAARFVASATSELERRTIVKTLLTFRLLTMLPVSLLALAGKPLLLHFFPSELLSPLFIYVPILFCVRLANGMLSYVMQGFHLYRKMAYVEASTGALNLVLVLFFVLFMDLSVEGFILAELLSVATMAMVRYWIVPAPKGFALDPTLIRRIIKFGLPLQGNDVLTFIFEKVDVLILGALIGPASVAYLEVAAKIPNYLRRLFQALYSVYFPHMSHLFAQKRRTEAEESLGNFLRLASSAMMFASLGFMLFQREVIVLIFSDKYLPAAPALGLLVTNVGIGVVSTILDMALISAGYPAYLLVINLVTAVASVLGNVTMIPAFGLMGAVYARLAANLVANPVSVWCLSRENLGVRMGEYLKPALFLVICLGLYIGLGRDAIILKALILILFVALSVGFSVVTENDVMALFHSFRLSAQQADIEE